jgi:N-acetyl-anhydromuramyl-L-alanine amidase AmpD
MKLHHTKWRARLHKGDTGDDVYSWQEVLEGDEYPVLVDGVFGGQTHNFTIAWQAERGLDPDGIVGPKTIAMIDAPPISVVIEPLEDHRSLPYIEAANWTRWVGPQEKRLIVIHVMEAPEASTTAESCSRWFAGQKGPPPRASAHYCIDDRTVISCVPPDRIAWHAPGANRVGIGLEHAGYSRQSSAQWEDPFSQRMLDLSAQLSAQLCSRFRIPIRYVDATKIYYGAWGITTHWDVTKAWGKSTHTDPGSKFPMASYLDRIVQQTRMLA